MIKRIVVLLLTVGLVFPFPIFSAVIGDFAVVTGDVTVTRAGKVLKPKVKDKVETADLIATGKNSNARVVFDADTMMALGPNTKLEMKQYAVQGGKTTGLFNQSIGLVQTNVAKKLGPGSRFEIQTPTAIAGVRGTAWLSAVSLALQPGAFSSGVAGAALAPGAYTAPLTTSIYTLQQSVVVLSAAYPTATGVVVGAGSFTMVGAGALPTAVGVFSTATVSSLTATLGASAIPGVGAAGAAGAAGTSAATGTTATGTAAGTAGTVAGTATVAGIGVGTIAAVAVVAAVVVAAVVASNSKSDTTTTHSSTTSHH